MSDKYNGIPIVSAVPKAKTILKLPTRKPRPAPIGAEEPPVPPVGAAAEPKAAAPPPPPKPKTVLKLPKSKKPKAMTDDEIEAYNYASMREEERQEMEKEEAATRKYNADVAALKVNVPPVKDSDPEVKANSIRVAQRHIAEFKARQAENNEKPRGGGGEAQALTSFKAKYGPALPKSAKTALLVKRDELEGAFMLAGMSEEKARATASKYRYQGSYGFRIHKTPKGITLSEEPSDFDKEMAGHEREMSKAITSALDRMKQKDPEDYKKLTDMLQSMPPSKRK